jgi:type II secretory ATPase GspE/PulE/Tfp pilus assembly ATPase PilB-like protein
MVDSLWDKLNQDATLANLQRLFRSNPRAGASAGGPAVDIDALLADARAEAERLNVSVGSVLRRRGFDVPDPEPAQGDEQQVAKQELMRAIDWEPRPDPDAGTITSERPDVQEPLALDLPDGLFQDLERVRIQSVLGSPSMVLRLDAMGALLPGQRDAWLRAEDGGERAAALLRSELERPMLLDVADAAPWALPHGSASTWLDELLASEIVSWRQFRSAQERALRTDGRILAALTEDEGVEPDALLSWLSERSGVAVCSDRVTTPRLVDEALLPWVRAFDLVPVAETKKEVRIAASFVPPAIVAQRVRDALEGRTVRFVLALPARIDEWRDAWLQTAVERFEVAPPETGEPVTDSGAHFVVPSDDRMARLPPQHEELLARAVASRSAVEVVRVLLEVAMAARATDIHVEPAQKDSRVRFRVDGVCMEVARLSRELFLEVTARVKVLADLDVTERRRPQDGAIRFTTSGRAVDLRIATVPTRLGEKLAVRIADSGNVGLALAELGLRPRDLQRLRSVTRQPHGLILATGPVGSGKTTTLYGCLSEVDRTRLQVVSIEDPVEVELEGANQVEVNRITGVDFVQGLRALLRQDPDVILIGEIRDVETAQIGVRAAMTGRMVYSTLHANSAAEAITTLRNFGIPDFVLSASLQGVIAQRLMRRVCTSCGEPVALTTDEREALGLTESLPASFQAHRGAGCDHCSGTGYRGRIGIFEVLTIDDAIRDQISRGVPASAVETYGLQNGMRSLRASAIDAIGRGVTTPEELMRVLGREEASRTAVE